MATKTASKSVSAQAGTIVSAHTAVRLAADLIKACSDCCEQAIAAGDVETHEKALKALEAAQKCSEACRQACECCSVR